jgi:tungstate transport system permease protein
VGLVIFLFLSRRGPFGFLDLLFTPGAMIVAQVVIASPYVIALTMAAVASVPRDVRLQAQGLGASPFQSLLLVVRSARVSIMAAVVAGFGAVISEVGAVMIVGGNIAQTDRNVTRVMTTDIVRRMSQGDYGGALALGMVLVGISFLVVMLLTRQQLGKGGRWVSS